MIGPIKAAIGQGLDGGHVVQVQQDGHFTENRPRLGHRAELDPLLKDLHLAADQEVKHPGLLSFRQDNVACEKRHLR